MKKTVKVVSLCLFLATAAFTFSGYFLLGLDDDGANEIDPTLETKWQDEEIGFKQVANLIEGFVRNQYERRNLPQNLEQYQNDIEKNKTDKQHSKAYGDLPATAYATRDVHRKAHGCFKANFTVQRNLDQALKQADLGVFQPGARYDAIVRLSNGHPQNRDDRAPDARGFAVKLLPQGILDATSPIEKQNTKDLNSATVLDILSINFPTFFVDEKNTAMKYYEINQSFLAGALDFSGTLKSKALEGLSLFTTGIDAMEAQLALSVNGSIIKSPLFQEYFSMVPSRLGPAGTNRAVKYIWSPSACPGDEKEFAKEKESEWPEWANKRDYSSPLNPLSKAFLPPYLPFSKYESNYLRKSVDTRLKKNNFCFTLYLQPYIDQVSTNIEASTDIWFRSEEERTWWLKEIVPSSFSPIAKVLGFDRAAYVAKMKSKEISKPVPAATLVIQQLQESDIASNSKVCEDLSFNPWNGDIVHHKPLGVISRLKRRVYNASRRTRHAINQIKDLMLERSSESPR